MATLKIVSETWFPHIACRLRYDDGRTTWAGWQPVKRGRYWSREDHGRGFIEDEDKEAAGKVNYYVTFDVGRDTVLAEAERAMVRDYVVEDDTYWFMVRDCVTFARDVAEQCGLRVEGVLSHPISEVDFLPYELLVKLYTLNQGKVVKQETDLL